METTTLELPTKLYTNLESLAENDDQDITALLEQWVKEAQRQRWIQGWQELRDLIREEGGLDVGETKEEIVAHMRKTRQEIFEEEYAHLYR